MFSTNFGATNASRWQHHFRWFLPGGRWVILRCDEPLIRITGPSRLGDERLECHRNGSHRAVRRQEVGATVRQPLRAPNIYSDFLRDSGPGLHHICVEADTLENFDAALALAAEQGATVPQQGVMPGGLRFAYLSTPQHGVPFLEIAHFSAEIRQFFDYIKQEQRQ